MADHETFIRRCYELARQAAAKGNHPFGALLTLDERVILEAENSVGVDDDLTAHAELNLLRAMAALHLGEDRARVVLYTSTEPCVMCSGGIYWAGISTVVYGCSELGLARYAGTDFLHPASATFRLGKRPIEVIVPILQAEGESIHAGYWGR
jgi:tRNA(Arg) A34 adenosine deaminase TadA